MIDNFNTAVVFIFLLLVLIGLHIAIVVGRAAPWCRFPPTSHGTRCQKCGYILFRNRPSVCAECGHPADYTDHQIPLPRSPVPPVIPIVIVAIILFPITLALGRPIALQFPQFWAGFSRNQIVLPQGNVIVTAECNGRGSARSIETIHVELGPDATHTFIRFGPATELVEVKHHKKTNFSPDILVKEFEAANSTLAPGSIAGASAQIRSLLRSLEDNSAPESFFTYYPTGEYLVDVDLSGGPVFYLPSFTRWCIVPWLTLSALTSLYLIRIFRKRLCEYEQKVGML